MFGPIYIQNILCVDSVYCGYKKSSKDIVKERDEVNAASPRLRQRRTFMLAKIFYKTSRDQVGSP